jgi:regulator of replication initiation timing
MNSRIERLAEQTSKLLYNLNLGVEEYQKINTANEDLRKAINELKDLQWDQLFAIEEDKRQELTMRQQKVIECYATLKRTLLEIYRDLFKAIKEM